MKVLLTEEEATFQKELIEVSLFDWPASAGFYFLLSLGLISHRLHFLYAD